jgi:hypothetical protein
MPANAHSHRQSSKQLLSRAAFEALERRRLLSVAVWTGSAGNGNWSSADNWQGNAVPTAGEDVEFPNNTGTGTPQIVNVDQAVSVGNLNADNTIFQGTNAITLEGNVEIGGNANGVAVIAPVTLAHSATFSVWTGVDSGTPDVVLADPVGDGGHGYGFTVTGGLEVDMVPCTVQSGNASYVNGDVTESYTGSTSVNDNSILEMNVHSSSKITASGGGEFFGSGSIPTISEGDSEFGATDLYGPFYPDLLTVTDGAHFSGGTFEAQLNGATVGNGSANTGFTELAVTGGTIDLGNAILSADVDTSQYTPTPGDVITIIKNDTGHSITGTFDDLPQGAVVTGHGYEFAVSYRGGASKRDVTLTNVTVPTVQSTTTTATLTGTKARLNVVGSDTASAGEAGLTYTWGVVSTPSGAKTPTFSVNGTNAANNTIAHLYKDGTYHFLCTATNAAGGTASVNVRVVVAQTATSLRIEPHGEKVQPHGTVQFATTVLDQFDHAMRTTPSVAYSVESGLGSISDSGLFTAGTSAGLSVILVDADDLSGTVNVTTV